MTLRAEDWSRYGARRKSLRLPTKTDGLRACPSCRKCCSIAVIASRYSRRRRKTCSEVRRPQGRHLRLAGASMKRYILEHRCDGRTYGGRQAGRSHVLEGGVAQACGRDRCHARRASCCPIDAFAPGRSGRCTEDQLLAATTYRGPDNDVRYSCQATQLMESTTALQWWDARQYVEAYRSAQLSPEHCSKEHCLSDLLLRYDGAFAAPGCRIALAVTTGFNPSGEASRSRGSREKLRWGNHSQARYGLKAGRTGAGKIVRADT